MAFVKGLLRSLIAIDAHALALFRMALALILMVDLTQRLILVRDFYLADGIYPVAVARPGASAWSIFLLTDHNLVQLAGLGLMLGLAGLLLVGWRTTWVTPALFLLVLAWHARSPLALDVGDNALRYFLFWLMLLPCGAVWSLDARREGPRPGALVSLAGAGILAQAALVYVGAGLTKLRSLHWLNGTAVAQALAGDTWSGPLANWLYRWPELLVFLTYATILVEAVLPYGLFAPGPARWVAVVGLAGFNLILGASIQLGLIPWILTASLLLFLPCPRSSSRSLAALRRESLAWLAWPVMLFTNLHSILRPEPLPAALARPLQVLMAEQSWGMYLTPYPENFRLRVEFSTAAGRRSVGIGARRPGWPELEQWEPVERLWRNYRTRMYLYDYIAHESRAPELTALSDWFLRRWNAAHPGLETACGEFAIVKELRASRPPGQAPGPQGPPQLSRLLVRQLR